MMSFIILSITWWNTWKFHPIWANILTDGSRDRHKKRVASLHVIK